MAGRSRAMEAIRILELEAGGADEGEIAASLWMSKSSCHRLKKWVGELPSEETQERTVKAFISYEERFKSLAEKQKKRCLDLIHELAHAIYGPCERQIQQDDLERLGVGASQAPDPDDYF